jgi:phosphoadenosine phosphosulfate reductase
MTAVDVTGVTLGGLGFPFGPEDDDDRHVEDPRHMRSLAEQAAEELNDASAEDVIRWATDTFGDRICITSSMSDAVVIHLVSGIKPGVDVLFLDTGYHFPETIGTRDAVAAVYNVNVISATPLRTVVEQDADHGEQLFARDPDRCCALRKVAPMDAALAPYDAWITGVRREESPTRADTPVVQWDPKRRKVKINPIARWDQPTVDAYIAEHHILVNPLIDEGFLSVGCWPCTNKVEAGADPRSGRWAGTSKTECGINI